MTESCRFPLKRRYLLHILHFSIVVSFYVVQAGFFSFDSILLYLYLNLAHFIFFFMFLGRGGV